jgi:type I restriction enzyme M protein
MRGSAKKPGRGKTSGTPDSSARVGFEEKLWQAADTLRGSMDAAEYKHVVLGLIFLKYVSDSFEERRQFLMREAADRKSDYYIEDLAQRGPFIEDRDEYAGENIFWVPAHARWELLRAKAKRPEIGKLIDDAMDFVETENPALKGILPKNYARPEVDKRRLGELIDLLSTIDVGSDLAREKDVLGRVYEYFLGKFATAEGKGGGEFYTPSSVVRVLVEMIDPTRAASTTPAAAPAACSSSPRSSPRPTAAAARTSLSSARSSTRTPGACAR